MNVEGDEQPTVSEADCFLKALEMVGNCYVATLEGMQYDTILSLKWMQPTASKQSAFNNERGAVHRTANRCVVFEESSVGLYEFLSEEGSGP
ncbi:hypothetical protein NC652_030656 [Populus alba x Populus x berolinensis]|nr:hypothetical protein NC652_030656 [Populus alba x Populus x berolinensis]